MAYNVLHLTDYQYYQLLLYIEKYGELVSIYEVAAIDGFDQNLAEKLSKFVEVKATQKGKNPFVSFFKKSKSNFLIRYRQIVEPQAGYEKGRAARFPGSCAAMLQAIIPFPLISTADFPCSMRRSSVLLKQTAVSMSTV